MYRWLLRWRRCHKRRNHSCLNCLRIVVMTRMRAMVQMVGIMMMNGDHQMML